MKFFQRLLIVTVFCFSIVLGTRTVHADVYSIGSVSITGNIDNGTYSPNGPITVTGQISNSNPYAGIPAYLSASTNGTTKTVVPSQTVNGTTSYYSQNFTAPSTPGSYNVAFDLGANIPPAQQVVDFSINIWRYGVQDGTPVVGLSVELAQPLSQAVTLYIDDEYWDSYVNGPDTIGFNVTIPAGQTGSSIVSVAYLNPSTISNTYISSNGQYTGVNGTSTNLLLGGTLLSVYGNTVLRLTSANVSYNFQCGPQGGGFSCQ